MEQEIWKDIPGYDGVYRVSNFGNILRMPRIVVDSIGRKRLFPSHLMRKYSGCHGYDYVTLSKDGVEESAFVQRVVAITFVKNDDPQRKTEVNHIDENKKNNRADNLEWITSSENKRHGTGKERMLATRKLNSSYGSEKKVGKFGSNGTLLAEYRSASEAARQNHTNVSNICACCRPNCRKKSHLGYIWKYLD